MKLSHLIMFLIAISPHIVLAEAPNPVQAKLMKESVWTGEGMPMVITLFSPGPFSGTASFDFPELSQTVFIAEGSPLVGSEKIDGESYFTQRHEFTIYTQRSGEIELPSFPVRFSGKKTFTSDPEPIDGATLALQYTSKRPPGLAANEIAIAADSMKITESWTPANLDHLNAGDVIKRKITRRATGTTAMMLPPVSKDAPDGVRVYLTDPIVFDRNERGSRQAERDETIKYQFERPGVFTLPELAFKWWDPKSEEYQQTMLKERTVTVEGLPAVATTVTESDEQKSWLWVIMLLGASLIGWYFRTSISAALSHGYHVLYTEETRAAARVVRACRAGDPTAAYVCVLEWMRIVRLNHHVATLDSTLNSDQWEEFQQEWSNLSQYEFGDRPDRGEWQGSHFVVAFQKFRRNLKHRTSWKSQQSSLPALNPVSTNASTSSQNITTG